MAVRGDSARNRAVSQVPCYGQRSPTMAERGLAVPAVHVAVGGRTVRCAPAGARALARRSPASRNRSRGRACVPRLSRPRASRTGGRETCGRRIRTRAPDLPAPGPDPPARAVAPRGRVGGARAQRVPRRTRRRLVGAFSRQAEPARQHRKPSDPVSLECSIRLHCDGDDASPASARLFALLGVLRDPAAAAH